MTSSNQTPGDRSIDKVVVVGVGSVGLPLSLLLAANGKDVVGVDIDKEVVDSINEGTLEPDEEEQLRVLLQDETVQENLTAQSEPTDGDAFVISVPTPLRDPSRTPDMSQLHAAIDSIIPYVEPGDVVNIESTIPPKTTQDTIYQTFAEAELIPGETIHLAHSPERLFPGNIFPEIVENDRIVGGITPTCAEQVAKIYDPFLKGEIYFTDTLSAELTKLMENTYRDVNVALANEFALIGEDLGVDINDIIDLANNHPRVDILRPGIGVGGHCLPVDPWFLNHSDPEHTNLITSARRINDRMPVEATRKIRQAISSRKDGHILALGAAYKPNTSDERNSPALEIVQELRNDGYSVAHYDRYVSGMQYDDLRSLVMSEQPAVIVQLVPHDETVSELESIQHVLDSENILQIQFCVDGLFKRQPA